MASLYSLRSKQEKLKKRISENLDILIGTITTKGASQGGHNLTFKIDRVTKSRHIRKSTLKKVTQMTERHKKLKDLLKDLSDTNWELLKAESE